MQVESSGTQTAVIGTEHTLSAPSAAKTRVLLVDVSALAAGEVLWLRFYGPVLSGGAPQSIIQQTFTGVLADPHTQSPPILLPQGGTITLQQTTGTGRSFPWAVSTLD